MKKTVFAILFVIGSVFVAATTANALELTQTQKQDVNQKVEWKCNPKTRTEIDSYGKTKVYNEAECEGSAEQEASQEQEQKILGDQIVYKETVQKVHVPVDTAMDTKTAAAALGVTAIGGAAYAVRRKIA